VKKNILVVEDDTTLGTVLKERLLTDYAVEWVTTQAAALKQIDQNVYDLVILDLGLPDGDGFTVARQLKSKGPLAPHFIFLTAQSDAESRLTGYELGAEEFIPKPFHLKELLMRVKHVLDAHVTDQKIELDSCSIDLQSFAVHQKSGNIEYPPVKDMMILKYLFEQSPRALSRDEIINKVWGLEKDLSPRTIDNAIARLRHVISDQEEKLIRSVRGVGYQWNPSGGPT
jgi:two-component system, OmpR family, phosphate regulon response regulator PhoB